MYRVVTVALTLVLGVGLAGCVEEPQKQVTIGAPQPSNTTIVVGKLQGVLSADSKLSWYKENFIDLDDVDYLTQTQKVQVEKTVRDEIVKQFAAKGVSFQEPAGSTRFQVIVAGAGSNTKTEELQQVFMVYPGLGNHDMQLGSVMISVVDTVRNFSVWRGVAEGVVQPNVAIEDRLARLTKTVDSLLKHVEL